MHSKVLAVLPMVCDRRWGRCGVSWRWSARKSITGLTMPMERKERKERNLMNQSNETATKEERI
eukprot:scaffold5042_cov144-Skeletonema_marinoi.AAC.1